jgi:hypothetical protein
VGVAILRFASRAKDRTAPIARRNIASLQLRRTTNDAALLDGVYTEGTGGNLRFPPLAAPTGKTLSRLVHVGNAPRAH